MKRTLLGLSFPLLLAPDSAPGLSVTGDADLDTAVMGRLGLGEMEAAPGAKGQVSGEKTARGDARPTTETAEAKAERAAVEAEETRVAELVKTTGKTAEEILAEEQAASDTAAAERETKLAALVEAGKSPEEAEAELLAEEEAAVLADGDTAVQTPELTPEIQTWHEGQLALKDEEIAAATTQAAESAAKVTELEAQLQAAGTQPLAIAPIDPLFLIDDPAVLDAEAGKLRSFEAWLLKHWDGVAAVEASEDGKIKAAPGYTGEEIRARYAQVKELREAILPAARQGIEARKTHTAQARKAYPELFDPKRPEFRTAENLLKLAPGLKAVLPNIYTVIGDALRGEKLRVAEETARARKGKVAAKAATPPPKVIKVGAGPQSTVRSPQAKVANKGEVVDTAKFAQLMEGGGTGRAALVASLTS